MSEYLSLFKNKTAESLFLVKYDLCLKQWPVPYEAEYIENEFGLTHVIKCGNKKGPALVLLHGAGGTSAMWMPNIKALSKRYYIIAVDIPGDPNKSKMKKTFKNIKGASDWLIDVINKLKIDKFSIMGTSYGSFFSMILAIHEQQRVEHLIICSPTVSITKARKELWFWIIKNLLFPSDSNRMKCLSWFNAGRPFLINNDYTELQILGMKDRRVKMTALMHLFSDEELQRITMPVLLLIGSKEVVTKVEEVKERAEKLIRNLTFRIIDGASHTLSLDKPEIVNPLILDFLDKNYAK
jgi:pimeloyl-ACP methyl ester carboxylesterase